MEFLYLLESIRVPVLNELMLLITHLGEETAFLAIGIILFWCVDKYHGYYLMSVGLFGNLVSHFLKITCRVPRPWVRDPDFTPLADAVEGAGGYSFPSGHSQTAVATFGSLAATQRNWIIRAICLVFMLLVPFSRMYLGVHTPADVLVGSALALVMVAGLHPLMLGNGKKNIPWIFAGLLLLCVAYVLYVELYAFPADIDPENLLSARKNGYTFLGCFAGLLVVYFADEKKFRFDTKAIWWAQILKTVLGLAVVLAVKEGTRDLLDTVFAGHLISRSVRYFLVVIVAGIVWPLTFRWFSKLGKKEQ